MSTRSSKDKDWRYDASVIEVLDGDTIRVSVDLGFHVFMRVDVRVAGINAPEKNTPAGVAAKEHASKLLPVGAGIVLDTEKPEASDKYGRWLAQVTFGGPTPSNFGFVMVAAGHAKVWDGHGLKPV